MCEHFERTKKGVVSLFRRLENKERYMCLQCGKTIRNDTLELMKTATEKHDYYGWGISAPKHTDFSQCEQIFPDNPFYPYVNVIESSRIDESLCIHEAVDGQGNWYLTMEYLDDEKAYRCTQCGMKFPLLTDLKQKAEDRACKQFGPIINSVKEMANAAARSESKLDARIFKVNADARARQIRQRRRKDAEKV